MESNYRKEKVDVSILSPGKKVQRALEMEMEKTATENGYHITGIINSGKSCYINSAVQSLNSLQPFKREFLKSEPHSSRVLAREL